MNKTVLLNIAGKVFHIEEDAYKLITDYDKSIREYFNQSEDGIEITNDIECRIAELLSERLAKNHQTVITLTDVHSIIGRLGSVSDFSSETNQQTSAPNPDQHSYTRERHHKRQLFRDPYQKKVAGVCAGLAAYFNVDTQLVRIITAVTFFFSWLLYPILWIIIPNATRPEDLQDNQSEKSSMSANNWSRDNRRKLFRNTETKMLGGVCSGLSAYWAIDIVWIRLAFILLSISGSLVIHDFNLSFIYIGIYMCLWIVIPEACSDLEKRIMNGDADQQEFDNYTRTQVSFAKRRLYRDPNNKMIGGVCFGLASYFKLDTSLVRLCFILLPIALFFPHDSDIPAIFIVIGMYLLLWILIPKAQTVAQKTAMRGETESLDDLVKHAERSKHSEGSILNEILSLLGRVFGWVSKGIMVFFGLLLSAAGGIFLIICLLASFTYYESAGYFFENFQIVKETYLGGFIVSLFVMLALPAFAILWLGLKLVINVKSVPRKVNLALVGVWIIAFICFLYIGVVSALEYQERGHLQETIAVKEYNTYQIELERTTIMEQYDKMTFKKVFLIKGSDINQICYSIEASPDATTHIIKEIQAQGKNRNEAMLHTENVVCEVVQQDSLIRLPESFLLKKPDLWRAQRVHFRIQLPTGKIISLPGDQDLSTRNTLGLRLENDDDWNKPTRWIMTDEGLVQMKVE